MLCIFFAVLKTIVLNFDMGITTKILVLADTFWKVSFFSAGIIGALTLIGAVTQIKVASDFWKTEWGFLNIKQFQARGFILMPLGLYILGAFLFVTQIVVDEKVLEGSKLSAGDGDMLDGGNAKCFFIEQVDQMTGIGAGTVKGAWTPKMGYFSAIKECGGISNLTCRLEKRGIETFMVESRNLMENFAAMYGKWVRRTPPSLCYHAREMLPTGMLNVPMSDFDPKDVKGKTHIKSDQLEYAPAYQGGSGFFFREDYFATNILTPCHYACSKWSDQTPVGKLLELGMVVGGGLTLVLFADRIGYYCGNRFVTRDTKPEDLANILFGDVRMLSHAIPKILRGRLCGDIACAAWWGLAKIIIKGIIAMVVVVIYRPYVLQYSRTLADRGAMRCVLYVSLYNTLLRSIFVFTRKLWEDGEDPNFRTNSNNGLHLKSFDLYDWMQLPARDVYEYLSKYVYGLGPKELESNHEIEVRCIHDVFELDFIVTDQATGFVQKISNYGAIWEGTKVKVKWQIGAVFRSNDGVRGDPLKEELTISVDPRILIEERKKSDDAHADREAEVQKLFDDMFGENVDAPENEAMLREYHYSAGP